MNRLLHVICDYGPGDLAWSEILGSLSAELSHEWHWHLTSVESFQTIQLGFVLAQLGLAPTAKDGGNLLIFANCAPRKDRAVARVNNEGEGLLYAVLTNGVPVVVVNSGYSLSFVRDSIKELWTLQVNKGGSQFRSRDYFPAIVGKIARGDNSCLLEQIDPNEYVPEAPQNVVGYIDSFGNMKTTYRSGNPVLAQLNEGDRVRVTIEGRVRTATVATGNFNVEEGDLAFAPGSSGHTNRFWELFQRGGSAWKEFGKPTIGSIIGIRKIDRSQDGED